MYKMDWTLRCVSVQQTGGKPSICEELTITRFTKTEHVQDLLLAIFAPTSSMLSIIAYDKDENSTRKFFLADVIASIQADAPLAGIQVNGKTATILIAGGIGGSTKLAAQPVTPPVAAPQQAQLTATATLTFKKGRVQAQDPSKSRAGQTEGRLDTAASSRLRKLCKSFLRRSVEAGSGHAYLPLEQQPPWVVQLLQTCLKRADATRAYSIDLLMSKLERSVFCSACATALITSQVIARCFPFCLDTGKDQPHSLLRLQEMPYLWTCSVQAYSRP